MQPEFHGLLVILGTDPGIPAPVSTTSIIGLLVLGILALWRGWVIFPRELDVCQKALAEQREENVKLQRDRDDWKAIALGTTQPLRELVTTVKENR